MTPEQERLLRENNRMLRAMRRGAFISGVIKFVFYVLVLVVAPLWIYSTYFAPLVESMQKTMQQVQGTNAAVQQQYSGFEKAWHDFVSMLPGFGTATSTSH